VKQRDAVILVLAAGLTYEEAGLVLNCSPGTVKSRVNRARSVLVDELNGITQMITLAQSGQMDATNLNALIVQAETLMARAA
jgi:RNA polymerase sigma-70 factor (ECF subfamily)